MSSGTGSPLDLEARFGCLHKQVLTSDFGLATNGNTAVAVVSYRDTQLLINATFFALFGNMRRPNATLMEEEE